MLVTTTIDPTTSLIQQAERLADEFGWTSVARDRHSLAALMDHHQVSRIVVAGQQGLRVIDEQDQAYFFHPSMAKIRVKRLLAGERDTMLTAANVRPGDVVIDATMGLASDAIVFAHAVGTTGRVTALESEQLPYLLAREGLQCYTCRMAQLEQAMRSIVPVWADHLDYLRKQPDDSADIVYFDPMFRRSVMSSAIEPLRELANPHALQPETVTEAIRVARRMVVMKEHNRSGEFERLGFQPLATGHSKITYGVIAL